MAKTNNKTIDYKSYTGYHKQNEIKHPYQHNFQLIYHIFVTNNALGISKLKKL